MQYVNSMSINLMTIGKSEKMWRSPITFDSKVRCITVKCTFYCWKNIPALFYTSKRAHWIRYSRPLLLLLEVHFRKLVFTRRHAALCKKGPSSRAALLVPSPTVPPSMAVAFTSFLCPVAFVRYNILYSCTKADSEAPLKSVS